MPGASELLRVCQVQQCISVDSNGFTNKWAALNLAHGWMRNKLAGGRRPSDKISLSFIRSVSTAVVYSVPFFFLSPSLSSVFRSVEQKKSWRRSRIPNPTGGDVQLKEDRRRAFLTVGCVRVRACWVGGLFNYSHNSVDLITKNKILPLI